MTDELETISGSATSALQMVLHWMRNGLVLDGEQMILLHDIATLALTSEAGDAKLADLHTRLLAAKDTLARKQSLIPEEIQLLARMEALSGLYGYKDIQPGLHWQMEMALQQHSALQEKPKERKG